MMTNEPSPPTFDQEELQQRARRLLRPTRCDVSKMDENAIHTLIEELQIHQIELEMQNGNLRQLQTELTDSRDRFSDLYEFAPVGYLTVDSDGLIAECNLTATRLLNVHRRSLLKQPFTKFVARQDQDNWYRHRREVMRSDEQQVCEIALKVESEDRLIVQLQSIQRELGSDIACFTAMIDITEARLAQEQLRNLNADLEQRVIERSEEIRIQHLAMDAAVDGILITTAQKPDYPIVYANGAFLMNCGYSLDEVLGRNFQFLAGDALSQVGFAKLRQAFAQGKAKQTQVLCRRKDRTHFLCQFNLSPILDSDGKATHFIGILDDITQQRELEKLLLQIASDEQRRFSIDLHDGVGQELTGLALMSDSLAMSLRQKSLPESIIADRVTKQIEFSLEQVRQLARGVNPVNFDVAGLDSALEELAKHVSNLYQIDCKFVRTESISVSSSEVANHLYRITQEAVTNAVKHGKAEKITIELFRTDDGLELRVFDNGSGFDRSQVVCGNGMRSMGYRANMINGTLSVLSGSGEGTVISCLLSEPEIP